MFIWGDLGEALTRSCTYIENIFYLACLFIEGLYMSAIDDVPGTTPWHSYCLYLPHIITIG